MFHALDVPLAQDRAKDRQACTESWLQSLGTLLILGTDKLE